jgi:hypothetical protein
MLSPFRPPLVAAGSFMIAATLVSINASAAAASLSADVSSVALYTTMDISSGTGDWAYFGLDGSAGSVNAKAGGPGSFSSASGGDLNVGTDSRMFLGFSGGSPSGTAVMASNFVYADESPAGSLSLSITVPYPDQVIQIYMVGYNSGFDFSASLASGGDAMIEDQLLPSSPDGETAGNLHFYGILNLTVTGASVGDQLTVTFTNNYGMVADSSFGNIGVQAATITAIPESSSWAIPALGAIALSMVRRRR